MSGLQRGILLTAAATISLLTWYTFEEGYIDGVEWLYPLLAVAALLFWAARGVRKEHQGSSSAILQQQSPASTANPDPNEARRTAVAEVTVKRMVESTERLADRIFAITRPPELPDDESAKLTRWRTPTGEGNFHEWAAEVHAELEADAKIQALGVAYSIHWYRPARKRKQHPPEPEFAAYRKIIQINLLRLVRNSPKLGESMVEMSGGGLGALPIADETIVHGLLAEADNRRMETEQDSKLMRLLQPALDSAHATEDRTAVLRNLQQLLKEHWGIKSPP